MTFVDTQVSLLRNGVQGSEIVENTRKHFKTHYSFEKNISNIRRKFLGLNIRHPQFETDLQKVFDIALTYSTNKQRECIERLNHFQKMSVVDQYDTLYRTRKQGFCIGCDDVNKEILCVRLLADNLTTLSTSAEDKEKSAQLKKETLLYRNSSLLLIEQSYDLLKQQQQILEDCVTQPKTSRVRVILALLFVSGRRECELLNGKSAFEKVHNRPYHVYFTGELKKKTCSHTRNTIPLLCSSDLFLKAFAWMRNTQSSDIASLTNKEISNRYCSQLNSARKYSFSMLRKTHDLRGIYVQYVNTLFVHSTALPLLIMTVLCHDVIEDSLFYNSISLQHSDPMQNLHGDLYIHEFAQYPL
jgi:hypothetical protein